MQNISWLESLAKMADYDARVADLLRSQSDSIQQAYRANDQSALKALLGGERLASKTTIFQL